MKNLLSILLLFSIGWHSFAQTCGTLDDYRLDPNDLESSPVLNVRLKVHVLQKSASDPQNFVDNQLTRDALLDMVDNVNSFYRNLDLPTIPVLNPSEEVSDSRIQFILDNNDIEFVVDYDGWNMRYDLDLFYSPIAMNDYSIGTNPANQQYFTEVQILGTGISWGSIREVYIKDQYGTEHYVELVDNSWVINSGTGITSFDVNNPTQINFDNALEVRLMREYDETTLSDNYLNYATNEPEYLHIFFAGGESANTTGGGAAMGGVGSTYNSLNMIFSHNNGGLPQWSTAQLLAHEIGHVLSLSHTNTPQFIDLPSSDQFCFCPCSPNAGVSNNIMGYNMCRRYLSPLQIASMRKYLQDGNGQPLLEGCEKDENQIIYINSDRIWNHSVYVASDIIIKNNAKLTVTCKVFMAKDARIIVETGSQLFVNGGHITSFCGDYAEWGGIDVHGNRYAHQTASNQGEVRLFDATLERAYRGVRTIAVDDHNNMDWGKTGGIVRVNNSSFINCRKALEFFTYHNFYTSNPNEVRNVSYITNSSFVTDVAVQNDFAPDPDTFISMLDVNGVRIRNNSFLSNRHFNPDAVPIAEKGNGIISLDANYELAAYHSIFTGQPISGTGNKFYNLNNAIVVGNGSGRADVIISDNEFYKNQNAVVLSAGNYSQVRSNVVETRGKNSQLFSFGIHAQGAYGFVIEENNIYGQNGKKALAVFSSNSSSITGGEVYKNTIENNYYGIQTAFDNQNLHVDCNDFTRTSNGRLDFNHYSGEIAVQGSDDPASAPANNIFGSYFCNATDRAQIYSVPTNGVTTYSSNPTYLNYVAKSGSGDVTCQNLEVGVFYTISTNDNNCPSNMVYPGGVIGPVVGPLKEKVGQLKVDIATGNQLLADGDADALITAINTQSPGQVKNLLLQFSPYLSDRVLLAYLKQAQTPPYASIKAIIIPNSPVGTAVLDELNAMNIPTGIRNQIDAAQTGTSERTKLELSIRVMETEKINTTDRVVRIYLDTNWVDSAMIWLNEEGSMQSICALVPIEVKRDPVKAQIHIDALRNEADLMQIADPGSAKALELKGFCEFHEAMINIKSRPGSYYQMTKTELSRLAELSRSELAIAANAQAILNFINNDYPELMGYDVYFPKSMTTEEAEQLSITSDEQLFKIMPNPSTGFFKMQMIEYAQENQYELFVTDLQGKIMNIYNISNLLTEYQLIDQEAGVYLIHLVKDGERLETQKLILTE